MLWCGIASKPLDTENQLLIPATPVMLRYKYAQLREKSVAYPVVNVEIPAHYMHQCYYAPYRTKLL
jgi:hypothetical protein